MLLHVWVFGLEETAHYICTMVFVGVAGCSSAPLASHVQHGSGLACRLRELGVYICIYIYIYKYFVALLILDISICLYIYIFFFYIYRQYRYGPHL